MKINEIILEAAPIVKNGLKPDRDQEMAMPAAHRVAGTADRHYDLNRVMMAVACADGRTVPSIPVQSWAGKNNIAAPYTQEEVNMLRHAYRAAEAEWDDALAPNPRAKSLEPKEVNTISPTAKIKPSKYGV